MWYRLYRDLRIGLFCSLVRISGKRQGYSECLYRNAILRAPLPGVLGPIRRVRTKAAEFAREVRNGGSLEVLRYQQTSAIKVQRVRI
jgi:hypothetical protein